MSHWHQGRRPRRCAEQSYAAAGLHRNCCRAGAAGGAREGRRRHGTPPNRGAPARSASRSAFIFRYSSCRRFLSSCNSAYRAG